VQVGVRRFLPLNERLFAKVGLLRLMLRELDDLLFQFQPTGIRYPQRSEDVVSSNQGRERSARTQQAVLRSGNAKQILRGRILPGVLDRDSGGSSRGNLAREIGGDDSLVVVHGDIRLRAQGPESKLEAIRPAVQKKPRFSNFVSLLDDRAIVALQDVGEGLRASQADLVNRIRGERRNPTQQDGALQ